MNNSVLLFSVVFSRLSYSVLPSDIITCLNDPQMVFSILEFSKIVCHYLFGDMGGMGDTN